MEFQIQIHPLRELPRGAFKELIVLWSMNSLRPNFKAVEQGMADLAADTKETTIIIRVTSPPKIV